MRIRTALLISTLLPIVTAQAGPNGGTVPIGGGSATIQGQGSANVVVNQSSQNAIINWNTFNVGAGEHVQFVQPNASSFTLNRVTGGGGPSQILGAIDANGRIALVNRDGFIFGAGAVINTAGFLATTADIRDNDFMAGRYNFGIPGSPTSSIVNQGTITATNGGFAALVAPGVRNSGTITARLGVVALGAGNVFNLDFYGDRMITLGVGDAIATQVKDVATGQSLKSLVTNDGKLKANGGRVELTAAAARTVVDSVINTSGVIEANSVGMRNGQIVLSAATGSTKGDGAPTQTVRVSGKLSAAGRKAGTTGGKIIVTGENIQVTNATINASGQAGGGIVMIGGDWGGGNPNKSLVNNQSAVLDGKAIPTATTVSIDGSSRINASALARGDGGKVIVWSDQQTSFAGTILALGGTALGNGGFAEVSSHGVLNYTGVTDLRATNGKFGSLLLDPYNVTISYYDINSSNSGGTFTPTGSGSSIYYVTLQNALALANVLVTTGGAGSPGSEAGNITVGHSVAWSTNSTLTLSAYGNIFFNEGSTISNTGAGSVVLRADNSGTGTGTVTFWGSVGVNLSSGFLSLYYNPSSYTSPTNFSSHVTTASGHFASSMLVNSVTDLQNIGTNLAGTYALGTNIDAKSVANFVPLGSISNGFTGILDGNGGLGTNYTISHLTIAPTSAIVNNIGLFAAIAATGIVRNVTFDSASVTTNANVSGPGQFVGIVAGQNGGLISNVTISNSTISYGSPQSGVLAGGIVGQNQSGATIQNSNANTVAVTVANAIAGSSENNAGGLVGVNLGTITGSTASGTVGGFGHSNFGGLVGRNEVGARIDNSSASAVVSANALGSQNTVGGLVGFNFGMITNSNASGGVSSTGSGNIFAAGMVGGLVGQNEARGTIGNSFATGPVVGGTNSSTGGFVGSNQGSITNSHATGSSSGLDNFTGGFVGDNSGRIDNSFATGLVTGGGTGTGGFAGENRVDNQTTQTGTITNSRVSGNVIDFSTHGNGAAGGFIGQNQTSAVISNSSAIGNVSSSGTTAGGFAGTNNGTISGSTAGGNVVVGSSIPNVNTSTVGAGGFIGANQGFITNSTATGNVFGGSGVFLGGFAGGNLGVISFSTASGAVTASGPGSSIGGFAGVNLFGLIMDSSSSGPVTGTSSSYLGGIVGLNFGLVQDSTSSSNVLGTGGSNVAGGIVGLNFGVVDPSSSTGSVTTGSNSIAGGFIGANGALQFPGGGNSSTTIGTFVPPPNAQPGTVTAGPGSTTGAQVGQNYPTSNVPPPPSDPCNAGGFFCGGVLFNPGGSQVQVQRDIVNSPLLNIALMLLVDPAQDKKQDPLVDTSGNTNTATGGSNQGGNNQGGGQNGGRGQGGNAGRPPINVVPPVGLGPLPSGMPPIGETRFASNEVVMQLGANFTPEQIGAFASKFGLEVISTQTFSLLGRTVYRFRITGGLPVRTVIAGLQSNGATISAQPSYNFELVQDAAPAATTSQRTDQVAPTPPAQQQGDSAQYIVAKLGLIEAHSIATGKGVKIAVIDSEIDAQHPDLQGIVTGSYDALPSADQTPHSHGTGMAGAIGSHQRLLGVAPGARILGIRAFGVNSDGAQGTSMNIVKGLEWAVSQGAQIINMSFAGPRDPILEQALKSLKDRGIILVGAAGNAGPKSPPLFPGADPNVIGVSATDLDDKTFKGANRGKQVAIAAPGVDILVPAPEGGYQLTTGTSVAAAEISGVIALMLERNKQLSPNDVRNILSATAKRLPQPRTDVGAGLVDPVQALAKSGPKQAQAQ